MVSDKLQSRTMPKSKITKLKKNPMWETGNSGEENIDVEEKCQKVRR